MATTENNYTGSTATTYSFTFPYLNTTDVKVSKNGTVLALGSGATEYTQATTSITLGTAAASGAKIRIYRVTDDSGLTATFYPGSAIRSADLNDNFTQNLYSTQENTNEAASATTTADAAVVTADAAVVTADAAVVTADAADVIADAAKLATDTYVHDGTNLKGDGLGGNPQGVKYAVVQAAAAVSTADDADANATSALNNSRESDGEGGYNSAISIANDADDNADDALRATDRLVATTSDDGSTWTLAGNNTNASTDPKGVGYAVTQAEDAVDKANAASAAVAASAIYSVTADLSSLTSDSDYAINSTNHEKFVQVNDTSGITLSGGTWSDDFATSSGASFPTSFDGHSQLSLKLRINNTTSKYDVQEYYANDPEARYGEDRKVVVENNRTITDDYTIQTTMNALSVGPVSIDSGKTLTIPANSRYVVL